MQKEREHVSDWAAISIPQGAAVGEYRKLSRTVAAVLLESDSACGAKLGTVRQLPEGTKVAVCGAGFTAKTVKVLSEDGEFYFLFAEDLSASKA